MTNTVQFPPRTMTERELRAATTALMMAVQYARRTLAAWSLQKSKPTKDEMVRLAHELHGLEEELRRSVKTDPNDNHLDSTVEHWARCIRHQNEILDEK
jgi:hypothetical protein